MASFVSNAHKIWMTSPRAVNVLAPIRFMEITTTRALAATFFASDRRLGRVLAIILLVFNPKTLLLGGLGAISAELFSHKFTQNKPLQATGLFALNGMFLGFAIASVLGTSTKALIATILFAILSVIFVIATERWLKTWDLPVIVLPYCLAFWSFQLLAQSSTAWPFSPAELPKLAVDHEWLKVCFGSLLGFGQILFSSDPWTSLAVAASVLFFGGPKAGQIIIAALLPSLVAFLMIGPHWAIFSGLTAFCGVLLLHAHAAGALPLGSLQIWAIIAMSGLFEAVGLKLAGFLNIYLISGSYVFSYWLARLCVETKRTVLGGRGAIMPW